MSKVRRNVAAGAATVLVASSAMLALPGSAVAADPIVAGSCGQTLQGDAGAPLSINLASALGISTAPTVGLGTVTEGTKTYSLTESELLDALGDLSLLGIALPSVCGVTVTGVKTVTESVEKVTEPVKDVVEEGTETVQKATEPVTDAVKSLVGPGGSDNDPTSGGGGNGGNGGSPKDGPSGDGDQRKRQQPVPDSTSPPIEPSNSGFGAPYYSAFSPMSAFSSFPYRNASFSTHAPGLRYGSGFGDYAPSFGVLGQDGSSGGEAVANAGSADALPPAQGRVGLPMLLAVLALAAASAGLVRSWVLRSIARVR